MAPVKSALQAGPAPPIGNGTSSSYNHGAYQPVASLEGNTPFDAENATDAANASAARDPGTSACHRCSRQPGQPVDGTDTSVQIWAGVSTL